MFLIVLFQLATFLYTEKQENELKFNKTFPESERVKLLSCVRLFAIPWTVAYQAPPSMKFSRQEYESGLPFPPPMRQPYWFISLESWTTHEFPPTAGCKLQHFTMD